MRLPTLLLTLTGAATLMHAQTPFVPNYDEAKASLLPIPDVLTASDGSKITTREDWLSKRRPEVFNFFATEVYGKTPKHDPFPVKATPIQPDKKVLGGKAIIRQTTLHFESGSKKAEADVLLFLPASATDKPVPVFVILNFWGNHAVMDEPSIKLSTQWFRENKQKGYINNKATDASRGSADNRYPIEEIISRGYGVATAYYGDFDPDEDDGFQNGIQPLFYREGQTRPADDEWGSIGAWAWGLSHMADYLQTLPEVQKDRLAVLGHSRLGKTSLWAGAQDERFGIVISNNSGAGGAALSKRDYGETVGRLNSNFPHWFCENYNKYSLNEKDLAMDQDALIALMAPRPVYIASATEDQWADPKGEFLGGKLAEPVYALFDKPGLEVAEQPAPEKPVGKFIGYHLRTGKHDLAPYDWEQYMNFADQHWK